MGGERSRGALGLVRRVLPWLVAVAILALLLLRVPADALGDALERTSLPLLAALAVGFVSLTLAADSLALWIAFRRAIPGARLGLGLTAVTRGASYLLQLVSYGAGQGGIVWFLRRHAGVTVAAGAGAVMLATGVFLIVIAAAVGLGLGMGAVPDRPELRWLAVVVAAGIPVYVGVIWLRPAPLARLGLLKPLFDAGVIGTAQVAAARGLHTAVLVGGHLAAMRLFGIDVPVGAAVAGLPVVFLIASLPIAPSGLGTTQAAAVTLFAQYAPGATPAAQEAGVLAYSLAFQVLGSAVMAAYSLACLRLLDRAKSLTDQEKTA